MTQKNTNDAAPNSEESSGDMFNTAAGWVLFSAGLALALSIVAGKYFHGTKPERPEQMGYVVAGVEEGGDGPAEMTMAEALTLVSAQDGEKVFAKCAACHTVLPGGANGVGPNLAGIMGAPVGKVGGFSYSSAMTSHGGNWGWEEMNEWLANPRRYIDGTKMSFAGLSKIEDRAAVALFLNGPDGMPLPEFVPAEEGGEEVAELEAEAEADATADAEAEQNAAEATSTETAEAEGEAGA